MVGGRGKEKLCSQGGALPALLRGAWLPAAAVISAQDASQVPFPCCAKARDEARMRKEVFILTHALNLSLSWWARLLPHCTGSQETDEGVCSV